jgi:hypothetical protein
MEKTINKPILTVTLLLPILCFGLYLYDYISFIMNTMSSTSQDIEEMLGNMSGMTSHMMIYAGVIFILKVALLSFFVRLVLQNSMIKGDSKIMWIALLFFFQSITMFIYMFKYVYGENRVITYMSKIQEGYLHILFGVVNLLPIVTIGIMMSYMDNMFKFMVTDINSVENPEQLFASMIPMFLWEAITFALLFLIGIGYIVMIVRNKTLSTTGKVVWCVFIFFGNLVTMVVYWMNYLVYVPMINSGEEIVDDLEEKLTGQESGLNSD